MEAIRVSQRTDAINVKGTLGQGTAWKPNSSEVLKEEDDTPPFKIFDPIVLP